MAHPPHREGDLTIYEWINRVLEHLKKNPEQKVGMKLDFKDPPAVPVSLSFLGQLFSISLLTIPLWINADILAASPRPSPFNPEEFLSTVQAQLPGSVLSLGWTTAENLPYTLDQINEMLFWCKKFQLKHVTFPLRSSLCRASEESLRALLDADSTYTLTIWDGPERMSRQDYDWLRETFDAQRLYLDVGEPI